jgi:hypothetical protein
MSERRADLDDGPIEAFPWPERITARVIAPGPTPRLHGYDLQGDIALHYRFSDAIYLALTGRLPEGWESRMFEVALVFLSPCSVAEAPSHAASLARICAAPDAGVIQVGAIGLAEQAAFTIRELALVHVWLMEPSTGFPASHKATDENERSAVGRLRVALGEGASLPGLEGDPSLLAALACTLFACGLRTLEQWTAVWVIARLPAVAAEAFAATPGDFRGYPMDLPHFRYEGGDHEG